MVALINKLSPLSALVSSISLSKLKSFISVKDLETLSFLLAPTIVILWMSQSALFFKEMHGLTLLIFQSFSLPFLPPHHPDLLNNLHSSRSQFKRWAGISHCCFLNCGVVWLSLLDPLPQLIFLKSFLRPISFPQPSNSHHEDIIGYTLLSINSIFCAMLLCF